MTVILLLPLLLLPPLLLPPRGESSVAWVADLVLQVAKNQRFLWSKCHKKAAALRYCDCIKPQAPSKPTTHADTVLNTHVLRVTKVTKLRVFRA